MMINMDTKKRLVNLDLLKVVSMVMIVCLHYLGKGGVLDKATVNDSNYYVAWLFEILSVVGVNCFILCTGYLMKDNRFRLSKIIYLWLQIFAVNAVCMIISFALGMQKMSAIGIIKCFFPITSNAYWYMSAYFIFYLFSPLLIAVANSLTVERLKMTVILLVLIFALVPWQWTKIDYGSHVVWFVVLFFVATYIRRADLFKRRVRSYAGYYLLLSAVMLVITLIVATAGKKFALSEYIDVRGFNFILTLISSVMLFAAFKNLKIKKARAAGYITFLSSLTLGVYLIHFNRYIADWFWAKAIAPLDYFDKPYFVFHMIACVLAVFFVCAFLEYFRQLLFKLFNIPSLCEKLGNKIQSIFNKFCNSKFIEKM